MTKRRVLTSAMLLAALLILPISALAGSFSVGGVTVTVPNSYTSCSPADTIVFDNPGNVYFTYTFFRYDAATNTMIWLGGGSASTSLSVPFPYPSSINGTLTFVVEIQVGTKKGGAQWSITCTPPPGGEGCTPGYWKNHLSAWVPTGYATTDDFDIAFSTDYFNPDITLLKAVNLGGGGVNRLARHGTAALLNAAHPNVDYPYTVAQVIYMVQNWMADPLAQANELGCRIP